MNSYFFSSRGNGRSTTSSTKSLTQKPVDTASNPTAQVTDKTNCQQSVPASTINTSGAGGRRKSVIDIALQYDDATKKQLKKQDPPNDTNKNNVKTWSSQHFSFSFIEGEPAINSCLLATIAHLRGVLDGGQIKAYFSASEGRDFDLCVAETHFGVMRIVEEDLLGLKANKSYVLMDTETAKKRRYTRLRLTDLIHFVDSLAISDLLPVLESHLLLRGKCATCFAQYFAESTDLETRSNMRNIARSSKSLRGLLQEPIATVGSLGSSMKELETFIGKLVCEVKDLNNEVRLVKSEFESFKETNNTNNNVTIHSQVNESSCKQLNDNHSRTTNTVSTQTDVEESDSTHNNLVIGALVPNLEEKETNTPVVEVPIVAGTNSTGEDADRENEVESDCQARLGGSLTNSPNHYFETECQSNEHNILSREHIVQGPQNGQEGEVQSENQPMPQKSHAKKQSEKASSNQSKKKKSKAKKQKGANKQKKQPIDQSELHSEQVPPAPKEKGSAPKPSSSQTDQSNKVKDSVSSLAAETDTTYAKVTKKNSGNAKTKCARIVGANKKISGEPNLSRPFREHRLFISGTSVLPTQQKIVEVSKLWDLVPDKPFLVRLVVDAPWKRGFFVSCYSYSNPLADSKTHIAGCQVENWKNKSIPPEFEKRRARIRYNALDLQKWGKNGKHSFTTKGAVLHEFSKWYSNIDYDKSSVSFKIFPNRRLKATVEIVSQGPRLLRTRNAGVNGIGFEAENWITSNFPRVSRTPINVADLPITDLQIPSAQFTFAHVNDLTKSAQLKIAAQRAKYNQSSKK